MQVCKYNLPPEFVTPICKFLYARGYRLGYTNRSARTLFTGTENEYLEPTDNHSPGTTRTNYIFVNHALKVYEFLLTGDDEDEDEVILNFEEDDAVEKPYITLMPVTFKKVKDDNSCL